MRILITVLVIVTICHLANSANSTKSEVKSKSKTILAPVKDTKTNKSKDGRGKRMLDFDTYGNPSLFQRRSHHQPRSYYPTASGGVNRIGYFSDNDPNYSGLDQNNYHQGDYHPKYPQYFEAPEPIIEIIIRESNETLPAPPPQPIITQKKKKEQVQVFYVKYKNDHHQGLVIDKPVPALSPAKYHQESHSEEEEEEIIHHQPITLPPPLKTTTLRTIIHPDSEKFHSESGIHVTFGENDKYLIETKQESSIQPVVAALPRLSSSSSHNNFHYQNQEVAAASSNNFGSQPINVTPRYNNNNNNNINNQQVSYYHNQNQKYSTSQQQKFNNANHQTFQSNSPPDFGGPHYPTPPPNYNTKLTSFGSSQSSFGGNHIPAGPPPQPPQSPTRQESYRNLSPSVPQPSFLSEQNHQHHFSHQEHYSDINSPPQYSAQSAPPPPPPPPRVQPLPHPKQQYFSQPPSQSHQHSQSLPPPPPPSHHQNNQQHLPPPPPQQQQQQQHQQIQQSSSQFLKPQPSHPGNFQQLPIPQQQQQFRPIPIPLHNVQQSIQSRPPPPPPQPSQTQHSSHLQSSQYNQQSSNNFGNYNKIQFPQSGPPASSPQSRPNPYSHQSHSVNQQTHSHTVTHNRPLLPPSQPPPPPQQPPRVLPQQSPKYQFNQQTAFKQQNQIIQNPIHQSGGLVQQAAPNLGPQNHHQHHQLNQYNQQEQQYLQQQQQAFPPSTHPNHAIQDLIPGGEVIKSVSKYEQHITENVPFDQFNQPLITYKGQDISNLPNLPPQTLPTFEPQVEQHHSNHQPAPTNIGPLRNDIGHLSNVQAQSSFSSSSSGQFSSSSLSSANQQNSQQQYLNHQPQYEQPQQTHQSHSTQNNKPLSIAPNSGVRPGQSVSTIYSEVFPEFENTQHKFYNPQQQNHQQQNHQQENQLDVRSNYRNGNEQISSIEGTTQKTVTPIYSNAIQSTTSRVVQQTHRSSPSTTTTTTQRTVSSSKKPFNFELPDEVPDELREQLLSSGILENADISILDYDKIGDVALENLPPEHLANFYGAGGASQISSSNKVLTVVKPNGDKIGLKDNYSHKLGLDVIKDKIMKTTEETLAKKQNVDLKVVRFDSDTQKSVTNQYIKSESTVLPSVDINDQQYNRYLPLKINGAQFPIPDVDELKGKLISSVVVLAPVDSMQSATSNESDSDERVERDVIDSKQVKFIAGDALKQLIKKPTKDNYKKWLDKEIKTDVDLQSVVLLVTKSSNETEQEIYMYDIATQSVNKLNGELSSAFVNVAEENAKTQDIEHAPIKDTDIMEHLKTTKLNSSEEEKGEEEGEGGGGEGDGGEEVDDDESESTTDDLLTTSTEVVDVKKEAISQKNDNKVLISSGYSNLKVNLYKK